MTSLDVPGHPLLEPLALSFADLSARGQVELVPIPNSGVIEVQADEWTLHIDSWPIQLAFIALDDDPASEEERVNALQAALGPQDLASMRDADQRLEGGLVEALLESRDALSITLGTLLREED